MTTISWELRNRLLESANKRLSILEAIIDDESVKPKIRVLAVAVLLNHGAGVPQVVEQTGYASLFNAASKQ